MTSQGKKILSGVCLTLAVVLGLFTQTAPGTVAGDIITILVFFFSAASMAVLFLPEKEKIPSKPNKFHHVNLN